VQAPDIYCSLSWRWRQHCPPKHWCVSTNRFHFTKTLIFRGLLLECLT